ncbi:MAG: thioredoxin domain-containing protein [Candidatus Pacebacteria bacterium]|nr:thioredoxin domain-containing protein [Candidatus Paceibacterota bacterium]
MKRTILLPGAIILAGVIIAISVYMVRVNNLPPVPAPDISALRPVSPEEHVVGNPTGGVVIVTYSDLDCAYCKQFERTMSQIMTDYGAGGQVAWVFRHLPLVSSHANAGLHAEASECVAALAGEDAFWRFIDLMHSSAPGTNEFNPNAYTSLLPQVGVEDDAFETCMAEGRYVKKVESDLANALDIGAIAAPYSVVVVKGEEPIAISGALTYGEMKMIIEQALEQLTR